MEERTTAPRPRPVAAAKVTSNTGGTLGTVLSVVLIIAALLASIWFGARLISGGSTAAAVKGSQYQALFLTNGQVYFGHLKNPDGAYVKLTDIYYLQVQQAVQPKDNKATTDASNQQVSLAKLGNELHGPEDVMYVNRDQVLFWENLKGDGKVTQAIKDFQSSGKK